MDTSQQASDVNAAVPWNAARPQRFLQGPQSRWRELVMLVRAFREMLRGFQHLHFVGPCITVFGSARFPETHRYYQLAREVGAAIAAEGFTVMTGGGPGIMEAANRGAREAGGRSVGCNIQLPFEQQPNQWLDEFVDFLDHSHLSPPQVRDVLDAIEAVNAKIHGYGSKNFGRNLVQTYKELAQRPISPSRDDAASTSSAKPADSTGQPSALAARP